MTNTESKVFTVTTYSHALCNPGYNETDARWLEGLWGVYSSESDAENDIFTQILNKCGNYTILYYDDIKRDEFGDTKYASYNSHEKMRFEIIHKDHNIPVIKSVVSIAETNIINKQQQNQTYKMKAIKGVDGTDIYVPDYVIVDYEMDEPYYSEGEEIVMDEPYYSEGEDIEFNEWYKDYCNNTSFR